MKSTKRNLQLRKQFFQLTIFPPVTVAKIVTITRLTLLSVEKRNEDEEEEI